MSVLRCSVVQNPVHVFVLSGCLTNFNRQFPTYIVQVVAPAEETTATVLMALAEYAMAVQVEALVEEAMPV